MITTLIYLILIIGKKILKQSKLDYISFIFLLYAKKLF